MPTRPRPSKCRSPHAEPWTWGTMARVRLHSPAKAARNLNPRDWLFSYALAGAGDRLPRQRLARPESRGLLLYRRFTDTVPISFSSTILGLLIKASSRVPDLADGGRISLRGRLLAITAPAENDPQPRLRPGLTKRPARPGSARARYVTRPLLPRPSARLFRQHEPD
jgi:hypothetical protein